MTWTRSVLTVALLWAVGGGLFAAQEPPAKNPLDGSSDAIQAGMGLFRGRCAECHGMDARGVRGPDITQVWASGRTDAGLFKTVKERGTVDESIPRSRATWFRVRSLRSSNARASRLNASSKRRYFDGRIGFSGCVSTGLREA